MRLVKEVVFWILSAMVLIIIFGGSYGGYTNAFFFVAFLMPVIIGTSYTFSAYLVPEYLLKKRYLKFSLFTFYTIIISLNFEMLVITMAFSILAEYQYEQLIPAAKNVFILAITIYFVALLKAFAELLKTSLSGQKKISALEEKQQRLEKGYIMVRADRKEAKILFEEVLFIESLSDYVKINLTDKPGVITKEKISALEAKLPEFFIRIHRSYIVNTNKITTIAADMIELDAVKLPVSRTYKKAVQQYIKKS